MLLQRVIINKINVNEYCSCDKPGTHYNPHTRSHTVYMYIYIYFRLVIKVDDIRIRTISGHENFPAQFFLKYIIHIIYL